MHTPIVDQIVEKVETLPQDKQMQVLEYIEQLQGAPVRGTPIKDLLRFAGTIPHEDLEQIRRAVEEDCERIDYREW